MAHLIGLAWGKVISVGVGVSAFESAGVQSFNTRVPEYLFSISETNETITSMETTAPNMALVCVLSVAVTDSQSALPISVEPSLSTLECCTSLWHFTWRNYFLQTFEESLSSTENWEKRVQLQRNNFLFFLSPKKLTASRKSERYKEEIKSKEQRNRKC